LPQIGKQKEKKVEQSAANKKDLVLKGKGKKIQEVLHTVGRPKGAKWYPPIRLK